MQSWKHKESAKRSVDGAAALELMTLGSVGCGVDDAGKTADVAALEMGFARFVLGNCIAAEAVSDTRSFFGR